MGEIGTRDCTGQGIKERKAEPGGSTKLCRTKTDEGLDNMKNNHIAHIKSLGDQYKPKPATKQRSSLLKWLRQTHLTHQRPLRKAGNAVSFEPGNAIMAMLGKRLRGFCGQAWVSEVALNMTWRRGKSFEMSFLRRHEG